MESQDKRERQLKGRYPCAREAAGERVLSGSCGVNAYWQLEPETGRLTIRGTGATESWTEDAPPPWYEARDAIRSLAVEEGITELGERAFCECVNLSKVSLAGTVEILGTLLFDSCTSLADITLPEGVRVISAKVFQDCSGLARIQLPVSLTNIDMKAFRLNTSLKEIYYGGTRAQWDRIMISQSAAGNDALSAAELHCRKPEEQADETGKAVPDRFGRISKANRYGKITAVVKKALKQGGDGRMYVLALDLFVPGVPGKSGDCTLIVFPDGQTMMIDAGHPQCSRHVLSLLEALELTKMDYFVLSHPHMDHVGGAMDVAQYIYGKGGAIGAYYRPPLEFKTLEPSFAQYLRGKGADIVGHAVKGDQWRIGSVTVDVYNPTEEECASASLDDAGVNDISLLLKFRYGSSTYLTAGDLYKPRERELAAQYGKELRADVMKLNHHGTYTSSSQEWLETVSPKIAFAIADDIGATPLWEQATAMGIAYYSAGVDGLTMIAIGDSCDYEVMTQYDTVLRKNRAE